MVCMIVLGTSLFTVLLPSVIEAVDCKGCVDLDSTSFEKVVSKFKASVVKFDVAYPYGEKHEQFEKLSEALAFNPDILVATVGVKDYGEKENLDLAQKYKVAKENYPVVLLFTEGSRNPTKFQESEFKKEVLQRFVFSVSGLWTGLPGCLKQFDELSELIVASKEVGHREEIISRAEQMKMQSPPAEEKSAEYYVKIMRKLVDAGDGFVQSEMQRIDSLRKSRISAEKQAEMDQRFNILQSFHRAYQNRQKTEL